MAPALRRGVLLLGIVLLSIVLGLGGNAAHAQDPIAQDDAAQDPAAQEPAAPPDFAVQPPAVSPPPGVELGKFRRIIQPFENWTLVCDEDLGRRQRVCNIRQEIAAPGAGIVFSWALSATEEGRPMMLLTVPAKVGVGNKVRLEFDGGTTFLAEIAACNADGCNGLVPVGPQMRRHIEEGLDVGISFTVAGFGDIAFRAPLKGLSQALAALD